MTLERPSCFVIMPFGPKVVGEQKVNFDHVYERLIDPAVRDAGFEPVRGDQIPDSGEVVRQIAEHVARDELVVVDITGFNANVMYELGMRHVVRPYTTVIICSDLEAEPFPFNIGSLRIIKYPHDLSDTRLARNTIAQAIRASIMGNHAADGRGSDNPVFDEVKRNQHNEGATLNAGQKYEYELVGAPGCKIVIHTGDLLKQHGIDVWVSSENTEMKMPPTSHRAIAAAIRAGGQKPGRLGRPKNDPIYDELNRAMRGYDGSVKIGTVIVTGSGYLAQTNAVRKIFHVASVTPVGDGQGFEIAKLIEQCVEKVLEEFDKPENRRLSRILLPLFGTGTAGAPVEKVAPTIIKAAADYLTTRTGGRPITVGFLARSAYDRDICLNVLRRLPGVTGPGSLVAPDGLTTSGVDVRTFDASPAKEVYQAAPGFRVVEAQVQFTLPDGRTSEAVPRVSFERGDSVAAVVVDTERRAVLLTRQFRYPVTLRRANPAAATRDPFLLELPAGSVDPGEDPPTALRRELVEEIGYAVAALDPISTFFASPGAASEQIHLYYAEVDALKRVGPGGGADADEAIEIVAVPLIDVSGLLSDGSIVDAKTLIGLTWLVNRRAGGL